MKKFKLIPLFFTISIASCFCQESIDKIIAVVGEKQILYSEIQSQKLQMKQQGMDQIKNMDCYLLDEFMLQQLLIHQAEIDSIEVTEEMVKGELDQRIQYFSAQIGGNEALEEYYGKSIQEIKEEFFTQIENKMKAQKMQQEISESISISPKEVRDFFNRIPYDSIPFINSKVKVSQLSITPSISYTQKNKAKEKLSNIRNRIIANELSFSVAAEFYSSDPGSKNNGGNFGWVDRGDFVPEFDAIAFNIPIGSISEVFESPFGFHILKIEKRRGDQYYGSHILVKSEKSDDELKEIKIQLQNIINNIKNGELSWIEAIKRYSTNENNNNNGIIYNESLGDMYWDMQNIDKNIFVGIKNLKIGEFSDCQYFEDNKGNAGYRIFKLEDQTKPHLANLNEDYEFIRKYALDQKKINEMNKWIFKTAKLTYVKVDPLYSNCKFLDKWELKAR